MREAYLFYHISYSKQHNKFDTMENIYILKTKFLTFQKKHLTQKDNYVILIKYVKYTHIPICGRLPRFCHGVFRERAEYGGIKKQED